MKNNKKIWLVAGIAILFVIGIALSILRSPEDDWIKDSNGIWVKHGNPGATPDYITEQQLAVDCAMTLYNDASNQNISLSSQCLGTCRNYSVDIVHIPRISEDNLSENQCADYNTGKVNHFIELDKEGEIVRVV